MGNLWLKRVVSLLAFSLFLFASRDALSWGLITHMTILDDILRDPRVDSEIKRILEENMESARGGVTGPDMFYAQLTSRFGDMAHYCSPGDLARKLLELAGEEEDFGERGRKLTQISSKLF